MLNCSASLAMSTSVLKVNRDIPASISTILQLHKLIESKTVQEELADKGTKRLFIVKLAPWYGVAGNASLF